MRKENNKQNQAAGSLFSDWYGLKYLTYFCSSNPIQNTVLETEHLWQSGALLQSLFLCVIVMSCPCWLLFPSGQYPSSAEILILIFHNCCGLLSRLPLVLFYNMKPQTEPRDPATAEESRKISVWVIFIWFLKYTPHCLQPGRADSFSTMLPHWLILNLSSSKIPQSYSMIGKYWLKNSKFPLFLGDWQNYLKVFTRDVFITYLVCTKLTTSNILLNW